MRYDPTGLRDLFGLEVVQKRVPFHGWPNVNIDQLVVDQLHLSTGTSRPHAHREARDQRADIRKSVVPGHPANNTESKHEDVPMVDAREPHDGIFEGDDLLATDQLLPQQPPARRARA